MAQKAKEEEERKRKEEEERRIRIERGLETESEHGDEGKCTGRVLDCPGPILSVFAS